MPEKLPNEDEMLLDRYLRGEVAAFDELVGRHGRALLAYIASMVGKDGDAEDIFQMTWERVIRNAATFGGGSVRAWIWRIAKNAVIDGIRRRKPDDSLNRPIGEDDAELGDFFAAQTPDVPQALEMAELRERIGACVARLPELQREIFMMRTVAELSFKEIADVLGIPLNTALGRMHYALAKLREMLADEGGYERRLP